MRQISVPEWKDFVKLLKIAKFKWDGGFVCKSEGCLNTMPFRRVQFTTQVHNKRLIFENHTPDICPMCTMNELNNKADIVFTNDKCKCDWCDTIKPTASFIQHKDLDSFVTFGSQWWNGHNICQECLNDGLTNPIKLESSRLAKNKKGETCCVNELGMLIKR